MPWFVLAAVALASGALLLASLPLPGGRRGVWSAVGALLAATVACLAAAGTVQGHDRCDGFVFDRDRWQAAKAGDIGPLGDDEETLAMAEAAVACRTLDGRSRAEVIELLGAPGSDLDESRATEEWTVGWVNDGLGLGDAQYLTVSFSGGRVVDASLLYDEYGSAD